jgi:heme-degrading monooxygenase HmoA
MANLIRVFRARVTPGKEDEFRAFFAGEAVAIVRRFDGLVSVQVGLPTEASPHEFLMVTTWTSLEALKAFTGEAWQEAYIDPREAPLLKEVQVQHYAEAAT